MRKGTVWWIIKFIFIVTKCQLECILSTISFFIEYKNSVFNFAKCAFAMEHAQVDIFSLQR